MNEIVGFPQRCALDMSLENYSELEIISRDLLVTAHDPDLWYSEVERT